MGEDNVVEPLGSLKRQIEAAETKQKALRLAQEIKQKEELEKRRCKHPKHSTYFVNKHGKCRKSHNCPDHGAEGCIAR